MDKKVKRTVLVLAAVAVFLIVLSLLRRFLGF